VGKDVHLASGTLALLLISFANLCLLALPGLYRISQPARPPEQLPRWTTWSGSLALGLAFSSQILYLAFTVAWLFKWMRFYPGNPIETYGIMAGLFLSAGAFVTALLFGTGVKRCAGVASSIITAGLWLLSAVASVAV
jgi:hypothetical protein